MAAAIEVGTPGWKNVVESGQSYETHDKGGSRQSMTGRYIRKVVPLEIRGISRGSIENHPLPDKDDVDDDDLIGSVPHYFLDSVKEALRSHSHVTHGISGRSSPTEGTTSHSGWTTGNTTERSSLFSSYEWEDDVSWGDEFDRQNSRRVRRLFEEIDSMLFEEVREPEHLSNLYKECQEWVSSFPHLRILGSQLLPPLEMGFHMVPMEAVRPSTSSMLVDVTEQDISLSQECQGLSILGKSVSAKPAPMDKNRKSPLTTDEEARESKYGFLQEEIFAQDGYYEDIIAVDHKTEEDNIFRRHYHPRVTKKGYPPLTPNACIRDTVCSTTFDIAWTEIVSWMRDILRVFREQVVLENAKNYDGAVVDLAIANLSPPRMPIVDPLPVRELSFSRMDRPMPRLSTAQPSFDGSRTLAGVLTISTKALQSREKSNLHDPNEPSTSRETLRPGSSLNRLGRPFSVKVSDQPPRLSSARKGAQRVRLAPIDRAKTPNLDENKKELVGEIVRGRRLHMFSERNQVSNERLNSPAYMFSRNGPLPPIGLVDSVDNPPPSQRGPRKTHFSNRASSAIADKDSRVPTRDRERYTLPLDNRPSTTHTFRSDTPFGNPIGRRSSTPMGFNNMRGPNMHNLGHNMLLGITGNSIGNPHLDPNVPQLDEEEDENFENMSHSQWVPSQTPNNPYRRGRQLSQFVR